MMKAISIWKTRIPRARLQRNKSVCILAQEFSVGKGEGNQSVHLAFADR
jgi:hypothetical protein